MGNRAKKTRQKARYQKMSYTLIIEKHPQKFLSRLTGKMYRSVSAAINALADDPRPPGCTELKPYPNTYRIRRGDIRIIYEVQDEKILIKILDIGYRGQVYDNW